MNPRARWYDYFWKPRPARWHDWLWAIPLYCLVYCIAMWLIWQLCLAWGELVEWAFRLFK